MKTKKLVIVVLFLNHLYLCQAQTSVGLYTSKGTLVPVSVHEDMSATEITSWSNSIRNSYPNTTILDGATAEYNCHGYAWIMVEGGSKTWEGSATKYLANSILTTEAGANKIYYDPDATSHSAIKSNIAGMYISKWAANELRLHAPDDVPASYLLGTKKYYYYPSCFMSVVFCIHKIQPLTVNRHS